MKRLFSWLAITVFAASLGFTAACGDDDPAGPTTGTVSGTVTFQGEWPSIGDVQIALYASLPPMGPPDASTDPIAQTTSYNYSFVGLDPATYDGIVVSWRDPSQPPGTPGAAYTIGMYWADEDSVAVDAGGNPTVMPQPITVTAGSNQTGRDMVANLDVAP